MDESILDTIRGMLEINDDDRYFDSQLIVHINTALSILYRLGLREDGAFRIHGRDETWGDLIDAEDLEMVKSYVWAKTKIVFDPPVSTTAMTALTAMISELEWSICDVCDRKKY